MVALQNTMQAWVIRPDRLGDPRDAMRLETIDVPEPGPGEVLVKVMAAGVNYNGVWAAAGLPVSIFRYTGYDFHIAGSRRLGRRRGGRPGRDPLEAGRRGGHPLQPELRRVPRVQRARPDGLHRSRRSGPTRRTGAASPSTARCRRSSCCPSPRHLTWEEAASYGLTYFTAYRMLVDRAQMRAGRQRARLGRRRRPGQLRGAALRALRRQRDRRRLVGRQDPALPRAGRAWR